MKTLYHALIPTGRNVCHLAVHVVIFSVAYLLAVLLRFDFLVPPSEWLLCSTILPLVLVVKLLTFSYFGAFSGWWHYLTFADLADLLKAATVSGLAIYVIDYLANQSFQVSRGVLILDFGMTVVVLGGLRASFRLIQEHDWWTSGSDETKRAIIVGTNRTGEIIVRQSKGNGNAGYRIVGFLDENQATHGSRLGGVAVLGSPANVKELARRVDAEVVLVAADTIAGVPLRQLMQDCGASDLAVKIIPPVEDIISGRYKFDAREVRIDDLLRRAPVQLDTEAIGDVLRGRHVMVTGAGGSIGSELCRQVLKFEPASLILVERFESALFFIHRELKSEASATQCVACIADILDTVRMDTLFECYQPEIVFHAAAHKHVPMMEDNPGEAIKNNILGTKCVADLAKRHGVERFVMISTDKAVNPTSVMGASKHLAERYVHSLHDTSAMRCVAVRFGNVLGSVGSVVPLFQEQIRKGGPVTVTHPEMTRYFMTIPEASQLVLQAASMGKGGEIFVLEMGELVKIVDLAKDMIRLSGFTLDEIQIEYTGIRPGEKMFEELRFDEEQLLPSSHPKLQVAYHRPCDDEGDSWIDELRTVMGDSDLLIEKLREIVPGFREKAVASTALPNDASTEREVADQPLIDAPMYRRTS